jgi:hypothetical protein
LEVEGEEDVGHAEGVGEWFDHIPVEKVVKKAKISKSTNMHGSKDNKAILININFVI